MAPSRNNFTSYASKPLEVRVNHFADSAGRSPGWFLRPISTNNQTLPIMSVQYTEFPSPINTFHSETSYVESPDPVDLNEASAAYEIEEYDETGKYAIRVFTLAWLVNIGIPFCRTIVERESGIQGPTGILRPFVSAKMPVWIFGKRISPRTKARERSMPTVQGFVATLLVSQCQKLQSISQAVSRATKAPIRSLSLAPR